MPERVLSSVLIVLRKCFPCNDVESFPHLVELLDEYLDTFSTQWTVARACNSGLSRRALEYLAERDPDWENGTNVAGNAVQEGFIHVLQWLNDCYPERTLWEWTQVCFSELAVGAQQFAVLKWLHANRNEECTTRAIDEAARIGRLDMIEWLHENRSVGCTTKAMVYAARDGYLDVVKWLHIHHGEKCTKEAMDEAARFGHLEVVKWLHTNCSEGCTTYAMDDAAAYGYLDVVRFLHENRNEGCSSTAMTNAAEKNHLDIVRYLYANRSENDLGEALSASVRCDQCAVVEYLSAIVHQKEGGDAIISRATWIARTDEVYNLLWRQLFNRK